MTGNWYMKGKVGIGTTAPGVALDIDGGTSSVTRLRIRNSANAAGLLLGQDTNTDFTLFNVSNGYLRFGTNNVERVRITASGNMGIGTGAPSQKLHVAGNLRVTGAYYDSSNVAGSNGQVLTSTGTGTKWVNPASLSDGDWVISGNNMYSGVSGNVGIGLTNPDLKLTVSGPIRVGAKGSYGGGSANYGQALVFSGARGLLSGWSGDNSDPIWMARYNSGANTSELRVIVGDDPGQATEKFLVGACQGSGEFTTSCTWKPYFTVQMNGATGIGTTTPSQMLHVVGNIRVTGAYYDSSNTGGANGQILQSTGSGTKWINPTVLGGSYILNQFSSAQAANFYIAGKGRVNSDLYVMGNVGIGTAAPGAKLDVTGDIRMSTGHLRATNTAAQGGLVRVTNGQIAIEQTSTEGNTRIFADFAPYHSWGIYHDNPDNIIHFTRRDGAGLESWNEAGPGGTTRTTSVARIDLDTGAADFFSRVQAPSFLDLNNNTFVVDPSGNTVINNLTITGTCSGCFSSTNGSFIQNQLNAAQ
ncbi:MAG: hypothetical protein D6795_17145, partial [Deltaproteobacteria bacterium]